MAFYDFASFSLRIGRPRDRTSVRTGLPDPMDLRHAGVGKSSAIVQSDHSSVPLSNTVRPARLNGGELIWRPVCLAYYHMLLRQVESCKRILNQTDSVFWAEGGDHYRYGVHFYLLIKNGARELTRLCDYSVPCASLPCDGWLGRSKYLI
jgi:hypothetical protein